MWTGPLPADAGGFKKGERPGENAVDTKTMPKGARCELIVRNCYMHGWQARDVETTDLVPRQPRIECWSCTRALPVTARVQER